MRPCHPRAALIAFAALCGALASCGPLPQTRAEFAEYAQEGRGGVVQRTEVVDRSLDRIVDLVQEKTQRCLNIGFSIGGSMMVNYTSTLQTGGSGRAELTVQRSVTGTVQKVPEDGYFIYTADFHALGAGRTSVVSRFHRGPYLQPIYVAIDSWIHGEAVRCPQMP